MGKDLKGKELGKGLAQRKDGAYTYRYSLGGRRIEERFDSIGKARRRKSEVDYWTTHDINKKDSKISLNTWFEYSMEFLHKENKERTTEGYRYHYDTFVRKEIGFMYIDEITTKHCIGIISKAEEKGYAHSTICGIRTVLTMLFREAIEDRRLFFNPVTTKVKCGNVEIVKEKTALTEEEVREFDKEARRSVHYNMIMLGIETGLRAGELGALGIEHIDLSNNTLTVQRNLRPPKFRETKPFYTPKTKNSIRILPLTNRAKEIIINQVGVSQSTVSENPNFQSLLFKTRTGNPVYPRDFYKTIKYIEGRINADREKRGIEEPFPNVHPHALRYTFATQCVEKDVNPTVTQKYLGHANIRTTLDIYAQIKKGFMEDEISKIERVDSTPNLENVISLKDFQKKSV